MKDKAQKEAIEERARGRKEEANAAMKHLGDPWDTISFLDKKRFGLHYYHTSIAANPYYGFHTEALMYAADMVRVCPRTILGWVAEFEEEGEMRPDARGKAAPQVSPMQDEEFRSSLKNFVKIQYKCIMVFIFQKKNIGLINIDDMLFKCLILTVLTKCLQYLLGDSSL